MKITNEQFTALYTILVDTYDLSDSAGLRSAFFMVCEEHTMSETLAAVKKLLINHTHGRPKPGDLAKYLGASEDAKTDKQQAQALAAWNAFKPKMSKCNTYWIRFEDKTAAEAVKRMGGVSRFGSASNSELTWLQKEFVATYLDCLASGAEHEDGYLAPPQPMFDRDDASRCKAPYLLEQGTNSGTKGLSAGAKQLGAGNV